MYNTHIVIYKVNNSNNYDTSNTSLITNNNNDNIVGKDNNNSFNRVQSVSKNKKVEFCYFVMLLLTSLDIFFCIKYIWKSIGYWIYF